MKFTKIRYSKDNSKLPIYKLEMLGELLVGALKIRGFITDFKVTGNQSLKLRLRMRSFKIDTKKLGYNVKTGHYINTKSGHKRTDAPTWGQRVRYNDIVNDILDTHAIKASVRSGAFTVRTFESGAKTEADWEETDPNLGDQYNGLGQLCGRIQTLSEFSDEHEQKLETLFQDKLVNILQREGRLHLCVVK